MTFTQKHVTSVSYVTLSKTLCHVNWKQTASVEAYLRGHKVIFGREGGGEVRVPECWTGSLPKMVNCRFVVTSQHPLETRSFHGNVNVRPNIGWVNDDITSSGGKRLSQTCLCLRGQVCVCWGKGEGRGILHPV